ncbi:SDR family NAD(P)-dependent oxidoreductase [Rhizobium sp. G21]|uniref:SDR family NAD(P)-dependent oxidoreductase n=1 Tax=Rhizobium sp. G21 TaxID=2758439 RepID=UPI0015FF7682|nr:SDR family NAD(P)-dependent oxidoreductase [Rhizobium sp. G21]MBB1250306.1 SDR family NAD(P)-dependent oxidoreductase [Rhizobium sp. G21]
MKLKGRTAIVTGAGGGLGRCHALQLASLGAAVVVNDLDIGQAQAVADEISAQGGDAIAFAASVTDEQKIAEMVETAMARFGRVDILVNNAGILRDKSFAKMAISDFRLVLEVHLMGSVICSKAVWHIMREQRFGRIVMTTSSSGLYGNFGQSNYSAAKMGLVGLMQTLALEGDNYNIRVNAIAPTAATSMTEGLLSPDALDVLKPERVSEGLLALVGDDAPTRTILCAGAGHFAAAHITLTTGLGIETGPQTPDVVVASLDRITDRKEEIVPRYGFTQAERELASVGAAAPILANTRP